MNLRQARGGPSGDLPIGPVDVGAVVRPVVVPAVVATVVLAAWCGVQVLTGTPWRDLLAWTAAVAVGVVGPGFVLVRAVRRANAPMVEDLAWGSAAGALVALLGWFADRTLPWAPGPFVVGPVVVAALLVWRPLRRRVLARPAPGWGAGPALALGVVMLVALAWMTTTGLATLPLDPGRSGILYSPDTMFQLSMVGELRHTLSPGYPMVAGTPLAYHWFLYAVLAHLTTGTTVDPFDSTLRLAPASLVPAVLLLSAVVARRLSGRVWAGPVAAALLAVVGISVASRWTAEDGTLGVLPRIWRASPPQTMGWLAGAAALGVVVAWLRRAQDDRAVPVALLVPFLVLAAGSKSSELPVLACGVGLALVAALVRRDAVGARRALLGVMACGAVFVAASETIYRSSSYGIKPQLGGHAFATVGGLFPGKGHHVSALPLLPPHVPAVALLSTVGLLVLPLLPRLLGLGFQLRHRPADPGTWVTLGAGVTGLVAPFLVRHPAGSEVYFLLSGYPMAVLGSASGLTLAVGHLLARRSAYRRRAVLWWLGGLLLLGALAAFVVAHAQPPLSPVGRWAAGHPHDPRSTTAPLRNLVLGWWAPTLELLALLLVIVVVGMIVVGVLARRRWVHHPTGTPAVALGVVVLLLGTGLFGMSLRIYGTDLPTPAQQMRRSVALAGARGLLPVRSDAIAAGRWVDAHAGPEDVVAVNRYCTLTREFRRSHHAACDARDFTGAALTQRRADVAGWAYADRVVSSAWRLTVAYRNAPFWDPPRLLAQYHAFAHPTRAGLDALYRGRGVRWLFLDLRDGPVDRAVLDRLAVRRFTGPTTVVWQLRTPVGSRP